MSDQDENNDFEKNRIKWEFFKLHANQRVTFFRFYIGLVVALFVAYFYLYDHLKHCEGTFFISICLILSGIGITIISYIFYALDRRNVELLANAKRALPEVAFLSENEPVLAYRHGQIFKLVFVSIIYFGVFLALIGVYKVWNDDCLRPRASTSMSETNEPER